MKNKCTRTNCRLENGLMYSYSYFKFNVIIASTTYMFYKLGNK